MAHRLVQRFGIDDALFSLKCYVAPMLAYGVALSIGLTRPYWAVTTAYIVAQPLAGAVLSKAVFRVAGTLLGAAAAVVLVPALVNAPALLTTALALWLGVCLYISLLDRTPRAYAFLLAGYTASIIGFPSVAAPGAVFTTAVLRVQEIGLGILCGSLVHGVVFPQTVAGRLQARIGEILADGERWSRDALGAAPPASGPSTLASDRRRIAVDIGELHQLATHLPFDTARLLPRVRTLRALQDQLSLLLPLASAVEDRRRELSRDGEAWSPPVGELLADVAGWLAGPVAAPGRGETADALICRATALEPPLQASPTWRDALTLSLLVRLAELIAAHRNARDLQDQMRSPGRRPVTAAVADLLAASRRRVLHRDRGLALRAAAGTVATVLLGSAFWIATAWADGAGAVLIAGVCCALFGNSDDPAPSIVKFFHGSWIGMLVAFAYSAAVLPRVSDFAVLVAVLAPPLLLAGTWLARPSSMLYTLGALLGGLNTVGLNDRYGGDLVGVLNGDIAQLVGTLFAVVTVRLFQTIGVDTASQRLVRAGWRDLARLSAASSPFDVAGWVSRMLDRIGLLAPRLAAQGSDPGQPLLDALVDLRTGVSVGTLQQIRLAGDRDDAAVLAPVLSGVATYFAQLVPHATTAPGDALLGRIDAALAALGRHAMASTRRDGVLALTSLRRNLYPAAAPYVDAVAA